MGTLQLTIALILFAFLIVALIQWRAIIHYRTLCVKLTKAINEMYCNEEGCTNLRYYTTPVDGKKGMMTDYCSKHLMERVVDGKDT